MSAATEWAAANWDRLLTSRITDVSQFLVWAAATERAGGQRSLRLSHRDDLTALRSVLHLFEHHWWAICIYSCVDRADGARMLARYLRAPVPAELAGRLVPPTKDWPPGMIGSHRAQAGYRGARICLMSLCARRDEIQQILINSPAFEQAVDDLRRLRAPQIGRTTAFDLALRAGQILHDPPLEPHSAHLYGSTGPAAGFKTIWGFDPASNMESAERAEAILLMWNAHWHDAADQAGVDWPWPAFSAGDFENALCIYQDRRLHPRFGTP